MLAVLKTPSTAETSYMNQVKKVLTQTIFSSCDAVSFYTTSVNTHDASAGLRFRPSVTAGSFPFSSPWRSSCLNELLHDLVLTVTHLL